MAFVGVHFGISQCLGGLSFFVVKQSVDVNLSLSWLLFLSGNVIMQGNTVAYIVSWLPILMFDTFFNCIKVTF